MTFSAQDGVIGTAPLVNGVAAFTTSNLAAGTVTVTASYGGTTNFAGSRTGTITTIAGNGTAGYTGDNGPAAAAELNNPVGTTLDSAGNIAFDLMPLTETGLLAFLLLLQLAAFRYFSRRAARTAK